MAKTPTTPVVKVTVPEVTPVVEKLSKEDLVSLVAERTAQTKKLTAQYVDALFEVLREKVLDGAKIPVHGFGTFSVLTRSVFEGRPGTSGRAKGTRKVIKFKMSKNLRDDLNS